MPTTDFEQALARLTVDDIRSLARTLEADTTGDEVDAWRATIAIDRALRHAHRSRLAAQAAWNAAQIVQRCAVDEGVELPDADVTHVARAAAEVARGLVAGDDVAPEVSRLLLHWFPLVAPR